MSAAPSPDKKSAIAQWLSDLASGKAALAQANADLAAVRTLNAEHEASIARLQADNTRLSTDLEAARAAHAEAISGKDAAIADLTSKVEAGSVSFAALASCLGFDLKAAVDKDGKALAGDALRAHVSSLFTAKVSAAATEQLAELGFNPAELPAPSSANAQPNAAELVAEYQRLVATDSKAAGEFYAKHRGQMLT